MATVDLEFAENIVKHNGFYNGDSTESPDNPRIVKIVKYVNAWNGACYGLIHEGEDLDKYAPSNFVNQPRTYWRYKS